MPQFGQRRPRDGNGEYDDDNNEDDEDVFDRRVRRRRVPPQPLSDVAYAGSHAADMPTQLPGWDLIQASYAPSRPVPSPPSSVVDLTTPAQSVPVPQLPLSWPTDNVSASWLTTEAMGVADFCSICRQSQIDFGNDVPVLLISLTPTSQHYLCNVCFAAMDAAGPRGSLMKRCPISKRVIQIEG